MKISGIYIYPIKSLAGISLATSAITKKGLAYDRRWMLVNQQGQFMTQRDYPQMSQLQPTIYADYMEVTDMKDRSDSVIIPYKPESNREYPLTVWGSPCSGVRASQRADAWFSEKLGEVCHLMYMADHASRLVDQEYARSKADIVSFADGFPILIVGQASLDELNKRLGKSISMKRFRPNLVFDGGQPHEEDNWKRFAIGEYEYFGVKPCARCVITTIDPEDGSIGDEPLKTLATYRKKDGKVLFGQNLIYSFSQGRVKLGDPVEVKELRSEAFNFDLSESSGA